MNKYDTEEYDFKALDWDNDPGKVERAKSVAEVIKETVCLTKDMTAFEYGCGTGLLSFNLHPYLKCINLADSSKGMLSVLNDKIVKYQITNMTTSNVDLTKQNEAFQSYDLIYTLMTLHHIMDVDNILNIFYKMLNQSGYLCIADLDEEDGSFHGDGFEGHNGFNKVDLEEKLKSIGFKIKHYQICFEVVKDLDGEKQKRYPLFVMVAQK
ncbi:MAG TPA: class I SAM-dependent methyltransferase [Clostridia bacterium]|nr:class I SAM-dependent methyltransferase [Clostridia bacterium]